MTALSFLRGAKTSHSEPSECAERIRKSLIESASERIKSEFHPEEIWLFGSAATAESFDDESDLDFLVVLADEQAAGRAWKRTRSVKHGFPRPLDLVFMSKDEFYRKKDLGGVAWIATREGQCVHIKRNSV